MLLMNLVKTLKMFDYSRIFQVPFQIHLENHQPCNTIQYNILLISPQRGFSEIRFLSKKLQ